METAQRSQALDTAIAKINKRWGDKTVQPLREKQAIVALPTGFPALDKALGIGGIPRGQITSIAGAQTSGMGTLALTLIANAHAVGDMAVYMDLSHSFDPDYAVRCGVDIGSLLVVRPEPLSAAVEMAYSLISDRSVGILVYDLSLLSLADQRLALNLKRLMLPLAASACAFICLSAKDVASTSLSQYTAIDISLDRERWLKRRRDVQGYRAKISILKNKFAPLPNQVSVTIGFNGVVSGDGV